MFLRKMFGSDRVAVLFTIRGFAIRFLLFSFRWLRRKDGVMETINAELDAIIRQTKAVHDGSEPGD